MKITIVCRMLGRKMLPLKILLFLAAGATVQSGAVSAQSEKSPQLKQSGTVAIKQTQVAFMFSGNVGGGTLYYEGKSYPFTIGGLGVGGMGVTTIEAVGDVYNLNTRNDFEGAYGQARSGITLGTNVTKSGFWLQNPAGVYLRLEAKRKGVGLSMGLDAIYIKFD